MHDSQPLLAPDVLDVAEGDTMARGGPVPPVSLSRRDRMLLCLDALNIMHAFIGTIVLALPYAINHGGLYAGIGMIILVAFVTEHCIRLLIRVKEHFNGEFVTYGELCFRVLGRAGKQLVDFLLCFTQFGFCCSYMIFISHNLHSLSNHFSVAEYLSFVAPVVFLMSLIKDLRKITPISGTSNAILFAGIALCVQQFAKRLRDDYQPPDPIKLGGIPQLFGITTNAFEGIGLVLPIHHSMRKQRFMFVRILDISLVVVSLVLMFFGVAGYLSYGTETDSIITLNMKHTPIASALKICLVVSIVFTYPFQLFPVTNIVTRRLHDRWPRLATSTSWAVLLRATLVLGSAALALAIPNFGLMAALIGSFGSCTLAFILPTWLHRKVFAPRAAYRTRHHVRDAVLLFFGVTGGVWGTVTTIHKMVNKME